MGVGLWGGGGGGGDGERREDGIDIRFLIVVWCFIGERYGF